MTEQSKRNPGSKFVPGDPRINRKGRPKTFDAFRKEAVKVASEIVTSPDGSLSISRINVILLDWATSKDPRKQQLFVEYAYGKVPTKTEVTGRDGAPIEVRNVSDSELESIIANGRGRGIIDAPEGEEEAD